MGFQAYLDTIKAKTGKGPDDFRAEAASKGLSGASSTAVFEWLSADYGLGRGHAMAIFSILKEDAAPRGTSDERIEKQFTGGKARWRPTYESLLTEAKGFGPEVGTAPTDSYVSLVKGAKKFAIIAVTANRLDLGLKLPGVDATDRLAASGSWNSMVTHRVKIADATEIDAEVHSWLRAAYDAVP